MLPTDATFHVARQFAASLDRREYERLRCLLADNCIYEFRDAQITGVDAIIATYRDATEWAFQACDRIEFTSSVEAETERAARITFTDRLTKNANQHQHICQQLLTVDEAGKVARITHVDLPGERESLDAYFAANNIHRPQPVKSVSISPSALPSS